MVVGEIVEGVDLLIVGAGPAGYAAALRGTQLGREVTLVDAAGLDGVGGVCLRTGCIPSKALIELADLVHRTAGLAATGQVAGRVTADLVAFQQHKAAVVNRLTSGIRALLLDAGVRLVHGRLRFTRPDRAVVDDGSGPPRFFEFRDVIIATGSRPTPLPNLPYDGVAILDSTGVLEMDAVPTTVAVVGAGYIGIELGTALAKLGAAVTIVEQADRILPGLDARLSRPVAIRLKELGVNVLVDATATSCRAGLLTVDRDAGQVEVKSEKVLVAVGRRPNTDDLGLELLGVDVGPTGLVSVGADRLARAHVAAVGDITAGPALAHKGYAEAGIAVEALCGRRVAFDPAVVPAVVFSDPEIATVGVVADSARAHGLDFSATTVPMSVNGRAATLGTVGGHAQLIADSATGVLLGVHIVGPHAAELAGEGALAIEMGATVEDLADTIHPHPTVSEQLEEAARSAVGRPLNSGSPSLQARRSSA